MRTRTVLALGVLLAVMTAGCATDGDDSPAVATAASGDPGPVSSAAADTGPDPDAALKYAKCMREQGLEWFPDPKADGRMEVAVPQTVDMDAMQEAEKVCKKFLPNGGEPPPRSAEDIEQERKFAQCMRDNGVSNYPDPNENGEIAIDGSKLGTGPGDPTFDAAEKACAKYHDGQGTRSEHHEGGGTT
ncbi:hypothetical protein Aca07nite_44270 [Actinoplanes capillaceus]|uniref:Lipoprotein n=1 Tax=Actinoplanes campanulatus TaxID=113559 RepID=A0ABQ3WLM3_9ACTN|nr:hypothetical protein [Actinoplanes capillaceus]GID47152.1 hypothetical protein Aca07nite_44270 [Actinoplanes capillaceus]